MGFSQFIWYFSGVVVHSWIISVMTEASLTNVAPNGTATQSSTAHSGTPDRAIDGNRNPDYSQNSCTHTEVQKDPWWRVSLQHVYRVDVIKITNRDIGPERLDGAEVLIGNSLENNGNNNPRCVVITHIPRSSTETFQCGGMEGRYVNVFLPGDLKLLTLCELEVYEELVPDPPSISASLDNRTVVVVGKKLAWTDALYYCRDFYWDLLTISNKEDQKLVEELLANASFPLTENLWLGLRRYLLGDTWFWMAGESMNYSQWKEGYAPLKAASPCGGVASGKPFLWEDRVCEEHLHFICFTGPQAGVKRVDFYSTYSGRRLNDKL